jgi:ATP-dependent DNA ligase
MLCKLLRDPFDDPTYWWEIKWNGCRAGCVSDGGILISSRSNGILTDAFPEILESLRLPNRTIVDSEIVVLRGDKDDFNALQKRIKNKGRRAQQLAKTLPATVIGFDCTLFKGKDLTWLPIEERRKYLQDLPGITPNSWVDTTGIKLFNMVKVKGLEGVVGKKKGSFYSGGARDDRWIKVRVRQIGMFHVVGFTTDGKHLKSFALVDDYGDYRGCVGSGMLNHKNRVTTLNIMRDLPDLVPIKGGDSDVIWKYTQQEIKVEYSDISASGKLIHPSIVR